MGFNMEGAGGSEENLSLSCNGFDKEPDTLGDEIVCDLDSYFEDVVDVLAISRMVNMTVIKGMVNAVTEEAAEKLALKDLEIASLKDRLHLYETGVCKVEREAHLQEQKAQLCSIQSTKELEIFKQLSSLHQEASSISRTLSILETGQQPLNGPHEGIEECNGGKKNDHFHHKEHSNHTSQANSVWGSNGKEEDSESMRNIMDPVKLDHMTKDEIKNYFKDEITKMKRNHESQMQEKTEEYFSLKREYLKNRGPLLSLRKDKDFEAFRKKIPEFVVKLNNMLAENETLALAFEKNAMICNLENRIDTLVSENNHLKDLLTKKSKEIDGLLLQMSSAADKISHQSLSEANLLKQIRKLKCDIEDMKIETLVREDVFNCILKELIDRTKCAVEESHMQSMVVFEIYEIILRESMGLKAMNKCNTEDLDMERMIMQEICGIIFREAAKDVMTALNLMTMRYEEECHRRRLLEASILEKEKALNLKIEENGQLKQELLVSSALVEEKKLLIQKEKEQCNLLNQELARLGKQASQNEILVSQNQRESKLTKKKLDDALGRMEVYQETTIELNQKLIEAMDNLKGASEEIKSLHGIIREKETALSLVAASEAERKEQIQTIIASEQGVFGAAAEFEARVVEAFEKNTLRLKRLNSQLDPLIQTGKSLKKMELVYNQKLEKRYSDLQKAEAEVDLLGDEVDALLSLLEKIYIALYHYSPVLQHYPGVMEILKLVQRELNVETAYNHKGILETARTV